MNLRTRQRSRISTIGGVQDFLEGWVDVSRKWLDLSDRYLVWLD